MPKPVFDIVSFESPQNYADLRRYQKELVEKRITDEIQDTILFLEHSPVVTRGKGLQKTPERKSRHCEVPVLPDGIDFSETDRGGDLTYHGPGQLVIYPIIKLDGRNHLATNNDIGLFIRNLENWIIDTLKIFYSIGGYHKKGASGVWVNEKKIASIGIAVKKNTTYHGIAINILNSLSPFHLFSPCGFSGETMTSLKSLRPKSLEGVQNWRKKFESELIESLNTHIESKRIPAIFETASIGG